MVDNNFLKTLPKEPGVYIMKNVDDDVIYVGKAKILFNRVNQYFVNSSSHTPKVKATVGNIDHIDYIVTASEVEALNLECTLIKKYEPKYNILLKDDKTYPYIKITNEKFPKIVMTRRVENDGKYFGPFISAKAVKESISVLRKLFKIRDCNKIIDNNSKMKPCLNSHIGYCSAPCSGKISEKDYNAAINDVNSVLNGNINFIVSRLTDKMKFEAKRMNFEVAAELRDKIQSIKNMSQSQIVVNTNVLDEDYIYVYNETNNVCVQMLFVRNGKVVDKKSFLMKNVKQETNGDILYAFIMQYYSKFPIPRYIYLSDDVEEYQALEEYLTEKKNKKVYIKKPEKGDKYKMIQMAGRNAMETVRVKELKNENNDSVLLQLKDYIGLEKIPRRIEAYDISNTSGSETVASMVVFVNANPSKRDYRRFKIKNNSKSDDYAAMYEVIDRRVKRLLDSDTKFSEKPDVIFVDGGKGQIKAACRALKDNDVIIPVYGIVKDDKHRTRDIISESNSYNIPIGTRSFQLAVSIQDEMHRCAITYHRKLRTKKSFNSELMKINGVGNKTYNNLMANFKTVDKIKNASLEELKAVNGINNNVAENIFNYFKNA